MRGSRSGGWTYNKAPRDIHVLCKFKMLWLARANPGVAQPAITGFGHGADDDDGAATDDAAGGGSRSSTAMEETAFRAPRVFRVFRVRELAGKSSSSSAVNVLISV